MLIAILLLGASAAQLALQAEKVARGERDWQLAFQAAEEALMDAEKDIEGTPAEPGRSAMFAPDSALGFVAGCGGDGASLGLCLRGAAGQAPVWQSVDFDDDGAATARSVPYGKFTGATMPSGEGLLPFKRPRYIIELLPFTQEGEDAGQQLGYFYRVTAIGFGARPGSEVVLQSFYRKAPGGAAR
ncbi:pilus assembly protein PilX [Janthinobacterium sp. hw3]|uniref:Pilus assembly protein PilX n=2 Tax=Janthinobacterium fluminis TaxID=2987524 RepID=A0ABT5K6C7_9BURK|nr:PilX N-terminal domain-containing pilus assembly protein [Janthinobacterium fluminis]MDC8760567.1 pilus assembly protein PilX [Janthinobacterium fluminis]